MVVDRGRIAAVGPARLLAEAFPDLPEHDLGEVVLMPGLVDAHCHLEWSLTGGLLPPGPFAGWLGRMLALRERVAPGDPPAAAALGALRALTAGTTTLADSGPAGAGAAALRATGLRGTVFLEVFGRAEGAEADAAAALHAERVAGLDEAGGERVRVGVAPHAPYSAGPGLWRALAARDDLARRPWATHLAESPAEVRLIERGDGPLADLFAGLGIAPGRWPAPGPAGAVARVAAAGALRRGLLAAHCVRLRPGDPARLAGAGVAVAHCPRSNAYLRCGRAPIGALAGAGVTVALGSDSPASGGGYDVRAEARAAAALAGSAGAVPPDPASLVRMATLDGARALGLADQVGSLEPGKWADLVAVRPAPGAEPRAGADLHLAVLDPAARIESVLVAGEALVAGGRHLRLDAERIAARAEEARARLC